MSRPIKKPSQSVAERFATLTEKQKDKLTEGIDPNDLLWSPEFWLRPRQLEALHSDAWITLILSGRGYGKTRTLSEWVRDKAEGNPGCRIALVGRTVADVRDTMVTGESGILAVHPPETRPEYMPSVRKLVWPNGSLASTFSAESPSQLRGPSHHFAAADELAAWKLIPDDSGASAWDNLLIGTRLGEDPQVMVATTPKRVPLIRTLVNQSKDRSYNVQIFTGATMDNATNLPPEYIEHLIHQYGGTALEKQELLGILLDYVEGAMWRDKDIRVQKLPKDFRKFLKVIAVDPGVTSGGDATGIVVCYATPERSLPNRKAYVVDDLTEPGLEPEEWANVIVEAHRIHTGALVVVEGNQGGDLVRTILHQIDPSVPVVTVHASKSKAARAEPVVMAYRMERVWHTNDFPLLQDEMTSWEEGGRWSPNRMDAMVHGLRALLIDDSDMLGFGSMRSSMERYREAAIALPSFRSSRESVSLGSWRRVP